MCGTALAHCGSSPSSLIFIDRDLKLVQLCTFNLCLCKYFLDQDFLSYLLICRTPASSQAPWSQICRTMLLEINWSAVNFPIQFLNTNHHYYQEWNCRKSNNIFFPMTLVKKDQNRINIFIFFGYGLGNLIFHIWKGLPLRLR